VGSVLSCSQGAWAPDLLGSFLYRAPQGFAYQWSLGGADIAGATQNFHTAAAPGSYACRVTAKNQAGSTPQTSARLAVAPTPACVVPKLKGKKLKAAKKRLRNANCKLGKVKGPGGGKVKNQGPKPGAVQLRPA
jgi:hypothetical protein